MNKTLEDITTELIEDIFAKAREIIITFSPGRRVVLFNLLREGYCIKCGVSEETCKCQENIKTPIQSEQVSKEEEFLTYDTSQGRCGLCDKIICRGDCFE